MRLSTNSCCSALAAGWQQAHKQAQAQAASLSRSLRLVRRSVSQCGSRELSGFSADAPAAIGVPCTCVVLFCSRTPALRTLTIISWSDNCESALQFAGWTPSMQLPFWKGEFFCFCFVFLHVVCLERCCAAGWPVCWGQVELLLLLLNELLLCAALFQCRWQTCLIRLDFETAFARAHSFDGGWQQPGMWLRRQIYFDLVIIDSLNLLPRNNLLEYCHFCCHV